MPDFPGVITTFARGLRSKISASTVVSTMHRLYTDETGNSYVGDGATQIKNLKRHMRIGELRINAADYGYSPTASASANVTALQAAADAAATARAVLFIPGGTGSINSQVTIRCNLDAHPDAVLSYTGPSNGIALQVGDGGSGVIFFRRVVNLPRVVNANKTATGWAQTGVVGTVGVRLVNCYAAKIHVPHIQGFETGLRHYGTGTGHVYNHITIGHLDNNKRNEQLTADATGWCNDNHIFGGVRSFNSSEGSNVSGTRDILIDATANQVNNNIWHGGSVEGTTPEYHLDCAGLLNVFRDVRWEVSGGARIIWQSAAAYNTIDRGYNAFQIVETLAAGAGGGNTIIARTSRIRSAPGTAGLFVYENSSSSAYPVDTIMDAGAAAAGADPVTAYVAYRGASKTGMKRAADAFDRMQLDHVNGRVYLGPGSVAPVAFLSGTASALLAGGGVPVLPGADATQDLGNSGLRWRNAVLSGGLSSGVTTKTGAYTLTNTDGGTFVLNYSSTATLTLPSASANTGKTITLIATGAAAATIAATSGNVAGATTRTLAAGTSSVYQSDGTNWQLTATTATSATAVVVAESGLGALKGWAFDNALSTTGSGTALVSGQLTGSRLWLPNDASVTNLLIIVGTVGAGLTSGQSFAALYDTSGNLLGVTSDQSTAWTTTGTKTMPIVGGPLSLTAGYYDVCFWSVGTTPPRIAAGALGSLANNGLSAANSRFFTADTGLTTTAPATRATRAALNCANWAGAN